MKSFYVYILGNKSGTLYTGFTNDIKGRVYQHKSKLMPGFTARYNINRLLYAETFTDPLSAIAREKQIKRWRREKKLNLIKSQNPNFLDLSSTWFD
jgi:putative endonuclease